MFSLAELEDFLKNNHSNFKIIAHETPILSVQDAARYFDVAKAAPVLIMQTDQGLYAFIMSAERGRIDFKSLKQKLGFSKLKMAEKKAVEEATDYHAGAVPLIGHELPCVFDNRLLKYDFIYGGSGDELHTLKIAPADVKRLNRIIQTVD